MRKRVRNKAKVAIIEDTLLIPFHKLYYLCLFKHFYFYSTPTPLVQPYFYYLYSYARHIKKPILRLSP